MSFHSIKKRENNELNEAGQFINIEPPVLMSSNTENSQNYNLLKKFESF